MNNDSTVSILFISSIFKSGRKLCANINSKDNSLIILHECLFGALLAKKIGRNQPIANGHSHMG